jgi:hypothetical protein
MASIVDRIARHVTEIAAIKEDMRWCEDTGFIIAGTLDHDLAGFSDWGR